MEIPGDADRDFTGSAIVVDDGELLLIDHAKHGIWLQPGGHVEEGETPEQTARRETLEETGVEIEIVDNFHPGMKQESKGEPERQNLPRPFNVNIYRVRENHYHCDLLYLAKVKSKGEATHGHEHNGMKWFSEKDLRELENVPRDVKQAGLKAIESTDF